MAAALCSCRPARLTWERTSPTADLLGEGLHPTPWAWLGFRLSLRNAWSTSNHPFGIWDNKTNSLTQQKVILRALAEALESMLGNERHVDKKLLSHPDGKPEMYIVFWSRLSARNYVFKRSLSSQEGKGLSLLHGDRPPCPCRAHRATVLKYCSNKDQLGDIPC